MRCLESFHALLATLAGVHLEESREERQQPTTTLPPAPTLPALAANPRMLQLQ